MTTIIETTDKKLADRYRRIAGQLDELYAKIVDPISRMGSAAALLHHKMPHIVMRLDRLANISGQTLGNQGLAGKASRTSNF